MGISVSPITPDFVAEIGDVDLSRPLAPDDLAAVKQAFWTYAVLIFPEQRLSAEQHLDFARQFGPLEAPSNVGKSGKKLRLRPELADVSNLDHEGSILARENFLTAFQMGNRLWHTDASFRRTPSLCSLLYAQVVPPIGGHTEFADQRAAYDALPEALRRQIQGRVAEHSIFISRGRMGLTEFDPEDLRRLPPVPQALVRTIPQTGRKSLYVAAHAGRIFGMPEAEGRALIDRLIAHATRREFVYTHRWRERDLVMWDNRCTLHRGTAFDDARFKRDLQRATVSDVANSCEQEGIPLPDTRQAG
ncbi:MAG: TauD/TfdA family dioxygenase [Candidatus Lambdaproteobacteria bacterium]|nr:TauD/TfdA family dioxygenase [Candidatus Lambdaproteobacteria bacterium]